MSSLSAVYDRVGKLGEGTYGIVYQAKDKRTQQVVALKRMVPVSDAEGIPGTTMREIAFLRALRHPNIVHLIDVIFDVPKLTLVFECCEMDLAKYLRSKPNRQLPGPEVRLLMRQFLQGLGHMHSRSVIHRDLKPHNLLLTDNAKLLKVADFGLARIHGIPVKKYRHDAVTLWYRPPDLLLGSIMYGVGMDVWSAGCIFAEMLSGTVMFQGKSEIDQLILIFDMFGYPSKLMTHDHSSQQSPSRSVGLSVDVSEAAMPPVPPPVGNGSQSPRNFFQEGLSRSDTNTDLFDENHSSDSIGMMDDSTSSSSSDIFPSFARYPNTELLLKEKGLAARAKQQLADPNWRPGFDTWVKTYGVLDKVGPEGVDLLRSMLQLEPSRRISASDALLHLFLYSAATAPDAPAIVASTYVAREPSTEIYLEAGIAKERSQLSPIWFPPAPLTAVEQLWGWIPPFASEETIDFGSSGLMFGVADPALSGHPEECSFTSQNNPPVRPIYPLHVPSSKIPVPPRRGDSGTTSTLDVTTSDASTTLARSTTGPPGFSSSRTVLSSSWTQDAPGQNANAVPPRRSTYSNNTSMVQLESNMSDQDMLSHAAASATANSFTRDGFLQSFGMGHSTSAQLNSPERKVVHVPVASLVLETTTTEENKGSFTAHHTPPPNQTASHDLLPTESIA